MYTESPQNACVLNVPWNERRPRETAADGEWHEAHLASLNTRRSSPSRADDAAGCEIFHRRIRLRH